MTVDYAKQKAENRLAQTQLQLRQRRRHPLAYPGFELGYVDRESKLEREDSD